MKSEADRIEVLGDGKLIAEARFGKDDFESLDRELIVEEGGTK